MRGSGLSSCLSPRMSWGWESYPVSIVGRSGAARGPQGWDWGTVSWPLAAESAEASGKLWSGLPEPWPVSEEAPESRDPSHR